MFWLCAPRMSFISGLLSLSLSTDTRRFCRTQIWSSWTGMELPIPSYWMRLLQEFSRDSQTDFKESLPTPPSWQLPLSFQPTFLRCLSRRPKGQHLLETKSALVGSHVNEVNICSASGCGTLDCPNLELPVSQLLKQWRSSRGAGVTWQRAVGRPCGPASACVPLPIMMLTYDINIPVIFLSYIHWSINYALFTLESCSMSSMSSACIAWCVQFISLFIRLFNRTKP